MLGDTANDKKASKFEDSDSRMTRPRHFCSRPVSDSPQWPSPRLNKAAAGSESEASGGRGVPRRPVGVRGTAPRSPLQEKKPVGAGAGASGAGSRVVELEAKLEKAHGQLTEMREQLTAAEKARKDAHTALVEAKKRFAAKQRGDVVATSAVEGDYRNKVLVAAAEAADVEKNAKDEKGGVISLATGVFDALVPSEREDTTDEEEEEQGNAIADGDGKKGSQEVDELRAKLMAKDKEVDELRAKLMAKDMEVYELRAKLMVRDTEVDELRETLTAKNTEHAELRGKLASNDKEVNKLTANLMAKDADIAALEADNADLTKMAEEAGEAVKATAARTRETEHALRESAAREARVAELLRASERAREALDAEAQRSRVHIEQWRKAAKEAAVVLYGGGVDCATADALDAVGTPRCHSSGVASVWTARGADEDGAGGKRKPGAMRVLSDLWKKKAQK